MERIVTVPLQDEGTALPIYSSFSPQFVYANTPTHGASYEVVELTDNNRYQPNRMVWTDLKSD